MDEVASRWDYIVSVVYYQDGAVSVTLASQKITSEKYIDRMAFKLGFLKAHNNCRTKHGVPGLDLNEKICDYAQRRAESLARKNTLQYNKCSCFGENIMCVYSTDPNFVLSPSFPVDTWYEEKKEYNFGREVHNLKTSNFTQIIWKNSKMLGVGWAKSKQGFIYVVANYDPPGNQAGGYMENVPSILPEEEAVNGSDLQILSEPLHPPPIGRKPRRKRFEETPDHVSKARNLAQDVMGQIEKAKGDLDADVHSAVKESKQKAEEMVKTIERIKSETEFVKEALNLGDAKQKMRDMTKALLELKAANAEVDGNEDLLGKVEEAQQAADALTQNLEELAVKRERIEHLPQIIYETKQAVEEMIQTFEEVETKTDQEIANTFDKAYQKAQEVVLAVKRMEEEQQHLRYIPVVVDKAIHAVQELFETIGKMQVDGELLLHRDINASSSETRPDSSARFSRADVENHTDQYEYQEKEHTPIVDLCRNVQEMGKVLEKIKTTKEPKEELGSGHDFVQECLDAHNEYREKHNVPPLKLNPELSKISQAWADKLVNENVQENNPENKYGENIYLSESRDPTHTIRGYEAVDCWYQEVDKFRFGVEPHNLESGHFTQVVWKDTTDLGVGIATKEGNIAVVCNYNSPGNILGQFTKNVPPVGGFSEEFDNLRKADVASAVALQESSTYLEENFMENFLKANNKYRMMHGVPPLALDEMICEHAQEWAEILAMNEKIDIRAGTPYGGNYYSAYSSDPHFKLKGHTPVDSWYDEKKYYEFGKEPTSISKCRQFSQLIWKSTKFVGVGVAKADNGGIFLSADYYPRGNIAGQFVENVPDLADEAEDASDKVSLDKYETYGVFTPFQWSGLSAHNEYREKHGVPALILNKRLCDFAKEWAQENLRLGMVYHRPNNKYGENIYSFCSTDYSRVPSARDAVKAWYDEIEAHEFDIEKVNWETLHFSQVIWRETKEVGMDIASDKGRSYIVANYMPRGNVRTQYLANVPRPLEGPYSEKHYGKWNIWKFF